MDVGAAAIFLLSAKEQEEKMKFLPPVSYVILLIFVGQNLTILATDI